MRSYSVRVELYKKLIRVSLRSLRVSQPCYQVNRYLLGRKKIFNEAGLIGLPTPLQLPHFAPGRSDASATVRGCGADKPQTFDHEPTSDLPPQSQLFGHQIRVRSDEFDLPLGAVSDARLPGKQSTPDGWLQQGQGLREYQ